MASCWLNGKLVSPEQAQVSVFDHGLLYGDGVFEGIRFYHQCGFRIEEHLQRLCDSAKAIDLYIPYSHEELFVAITDTINHYVESDTGKKVEANGYLRVVVTRGTGSLGLDPGQCQRATVFVLADQLAFASPNAIEKGLSLIIASTRRLPVDGLDPRIKSLNYLNHTLARMEATRANADEAILLNQQGHVTEGSTDNIFIVKNNVLLTPPITDGALAGITRELILELSESLGVENDQRSLSPFDLYTADECFLTGTAIEVLPVREIDGRHITQCPGPVFQILKQAFILRIEKETRPDLQQAGVI